MAFKIADGYVEVHGRLDEPSFRRAAERAGGRAGDRFATAFGLSSSRRFRRMTNLFMDPINALSAALSALRMPALKGGILGSILALLPSLGQATAAVGAGLIPALLSLGSVIGVVRLMLGKLNEDIKSQTLKQLNSMAGAMRDLAREAAKPGLNKFFEGVVENAAMFERYIQRIAKAVGDALGDVGDLLGDAGFVGKLSKLLDSVAKGTATWTRALDDVVEMVVTLGAAAGPIFEDFAQRIVETTDRWRDFLNLKYETGELQAFLGKAAEELARWGRIFNNVIIGLFNIFAAGVGPSSQFAANLERMTASFRAWTQEAGNVEKIRKVFQFMVDHVDDFFRLAASALAVATALKGIGLAVEAITWVRMIAALGPLGIALGVVGLAVAGLSAAFFLAFNRSEAFRAKVGELWTMVQERLFPILKEWGAWISEELLPVLDKLATEIMTVVVASFDHILSKLEQNKEGLAEFRDVIIALAPVVGNFAKAVIIHFAAAVGAVITMIGWIGRLVGAIKSIPTKWATVFSFLFGAAFELISRLTGLIRAIPRAWSTAFSFLVGAAFGLASRATSLVRAIPTAWRTLYSFIVGGALGAINRVKGALSSIPRSIRTVYTLVTNSIKNIINRVLPGAHGGIVGSQGMATGGIVGGRTMLVGEQGPELVELPFGARVIPAGMTRAMLEGRAKRGDDGATMQPVFNVRVFVGDRELTDIVAVEVDHHQRERDRYLRRTVTARSGTR